MHNESRYNEAMTQIAPASDASGEALSRRHQYAEDEHGYLYDTGFREVLVQRAKVDRDTIPRAEAVRALVMAGKYLGHLLEDSMNEVGISYGQFKALMCIKNFGISGTQMHAIAGYLGVTPRNVTGLVDGLETAGLDLVIIGLCKIPLDPICRAVELTEDVEFNHLVQFLY